MEENSLAAKQEPLVEDASSHSRRRGRSRVSTAGGSSSASTSSQPLAKMDSAAEVIAADEANSAANDGASKSTLAAPPSTSTTPEARQSASSSAPSSISLEDLSRPVAPPIIGIQAAGNNGQQTPRSSSLLSDASLRSDDSTRTLGSLDRTAPEQLSAVERMKQSLKHVYRQRYRVSASIKGLAGIPHLSRNNRPYHDGHGAPRGGVGDGGAKALANATAAARRGSTIAAAGGWQAAQAAAGRRGSTAFTPPPGATTRTSLILTANNQPRKWRFRRRLVDEGGITPRAYLRSIIRQVFLPMYMIFVSRTANNDGPRWFRRHQTELVVDALVLLLMFSNIILFEHGCSSGTITFDSLQQVEVYSPVVMWSVAVLLYGYYGQYFDADILWPLRHVCVPNRVEAENDLASHVIDEIGLAVDGTSMADLVLLGDRVAGSRYGSNTHPSPSPSNANGAQTAYRNWKVQHWQGRWLETQRPGIRGSDFPEFFSQREDGVFHALDLSHGLLAMSKSIEGGAGVPTRATAFAIFQSLFTLMYRCVTRMEELRHMETMATVVLIFSVITTFHYGRMLIIMMHNAYEVLRERRALNSYIGALLDEESARWFGVPYIDIATPTKCPPNLMSWAQLRFVLQRVSNRNVTKLYMQLNVHLVISLVLWILCYIHVLNFDYSDDGGKNGSSALAILAYTTFTAVLISGYLLNTLESGGKSNTQQRKHWTRLYGAAFAMRQQQIVLTRKNLKEDFDNVELACAMIRAEAEDIKLNDEFCVIFGFIVGDNLITRILVAFSTIVFAVLIEVWVKN